MQQKYFLYARKSSEGEERQALSIEAQIAELKTYAERERLSIVEIFTESKSAKQPGRPIFNHMIERIESGEANGIIAWHPDRLARNSVDGGRIVFMLDTNKIEFLKFPTFWFENTPQGKFMLNIAFGQSKYYVDNLSENVRRGIRQKLRRGEWPSFAPIGYLNDKATRKIVLDHERAPLVKKLFEEYATGKHSLKTIRTYSQQIGLVSKKGKSLGKARIHCTLRNPIYYGVLEHKGEFYQGCHEPIITKELFDKVQEAFANKGKPRNYKKQRFPFLGLATCPHCGCAITAERQKGHHYYRCTGKRGNCKEPYTREERISFQLQHALSRVALPEQEYKAMKAELEKERHAANQLTAHKVSQLNDQIKEIQEKIDKLVDMHLEALVSKEEFLAKKKALLNEKVLLTEQKEKIETGAVSWLEPCLNFLAAANHADLLADSTNLEAQKEFIKKIGSNHKLSGQRLRFGWRKPWHLFARKYAYYGHLPHSHTYKKSPRKVFFRGQLVSPAESYVKWSGRQDSNLRRPAPKAGTLPG